MNTEVKTLISLEEHNYKAAQKYNRPVLKFNGIACPKCQEELLDSNDEATLLSNPPQKNIYCLKCDFRGRRII